MNITTVGIDLAKNVFRVHAVDVRGKAVLRKQLKKGPGEIVFREPASLLDRHGGLREFPSLGTDADRGDLWLEQRRPPPAQDASGGTESRPLHRDPYDRLQQPAARGQAALRSGHGVGRGVDEIRHTP
jgi:hypothetical protein